MNKKIVFLLLCATTAFNSHLAYGIKNSNIDVSHTPYQASMLGKLLSYGTFYELKHNIIELLHTAKKITLSEKALYTAPVQQLVKEHAVQDIQDSITITVPARIKDLQDSSYLYQNIKINDQLHEQITVDKSRFNLIPLHAQYSFTHPEGAVQKSLNTICNDHRYMHVVPTLGLFAALCTVAFSYNFEKPSEHTVANALKITGVAALYAGAMKLWYAYKAKQYAQILQEVQALESITPQEQFLLFVTKLVALHPQAVTFAADGTMETACADNLKNIALEFFGIELTPEQLTKEYLTLKINHTS